MTLVAPVLELDVNFSTPPLTQPQDNLVLQANQSAGVSSFVVVNAGAVTTLLHGGDVIQIGTGATREVLTVNTFTGAYPGTVTTTTPTQYAHTTAETITTWIDLTAWVENEWIEVRKGKQHLIGQVMPSTLTLRLDNNDRRFDPSNTAGPYQPILLDRWVRLTETLSGTSHVLFTGYTSEWSRKYPSIGHSYIQVKAGDIFDLLARKNITSTLYQPTVLADTPLGYWRLGDPVGSLTAADSSGNGYTGTVNGAVTFGADGGLLADVDTAMDVSGATGYISLPGASAPSGTGDVTVELWAKVNAINLGAYSFIPIWSAAQDSIRLSINGTGVPRLSAYDSLLTNGGFIDSDIAINDSKWHHIVVVRPSGTTPTGWSMWIDGVQRTVTATVVGTGSGNVPASTVALIAGRNPAGTPSAAFDGLVDEVAVYTTALSSARITAHYNAGIGFPAQLTGARIGNVLDLLGIPSTAAWRSIQAGQTSLPAATGSLVTTKALAHMQQVGDSENGALWVTGPGVITFLQRSALLLSPYTTSQATFDDVGDGTVLGYQKASPEIVFNLDDTYNEVTVTPPSPGVVQTATDAASRSSYGTRTLSRSTLATSAQENQNSAQYLINRFKTPLERITQVEVMPMWNGGTLAEAVLARDLYDRITVKKRPPGGGAVFSQESLIEGITHKIKAGHWVTTFALSPADTQAYWIWGTSKWGTDTRWAY